MNRYTTYLRAIVTVAAITLAAGCNELHEPDSQGTSMNIKPVFDAEIPTSLTKAGGQMESLTLEPLILDDGMQIDMSVTRDREWPIAGPGCDTVLTKGTVYSGDAAYEAKSFRLYAWNASQSNAVLFSGKEYTCGSDHIWSCTSPEQWPGTEDKIAFAGVWDSAESAALTLVSGEYQLKDWDVSGDVGAQKDFRVAYATYPADYNNDALLYFNPYMNAIQVKVGTLPAGYKVTKVSLKSVGVKGTLSFSGDYTPTPPVTGRDSYVGAWSNITKNTLSLTGSWESGNSVTPDGTAFLIIDEDGGTLAGNIEVIFSDPKNRTVTKTLALSALGEDVRCGESYTLNIGSTFVYTFSLGNSSDAEKTFQNTDSPLTSNIPITSTVKINGGSANEVAWSIKSIKIGSSDEESIAAGAFTDKGGLSSTADLANKRLSLVASARTRQMRGLNDYWTGGNGAWSPESWESRDVIDLSRYDYKNETTDNAMSTANCYIIRHAGTYKIPLVYGNAIANGIEDTDSYNPTMAAGGQSGYFLSRFRNHLNSGITSAFIENNTGCVAGGDECSILWQDEAEVIKNLQLVSGASTAAPGSYNKDNVRYLQFTVSQEDICQNNALIAVRDEDNKIMWSWHIWTTNDPALLSGAIPVINHAGNEYDFFPLYCLGWVDSGAYPGRDDVRIVLVQEGSGYEIEILVRQIEVRARSNGCYYQFGRKDPMCRMDDPAIGRFVKNGSGQVTLGKAIQHPSTHYVTTTACDWCSSNYLNLWTGKYCKTSSSGVENSDAFIKTVYDPSPVGYMVPTTGAFTGFTKDGGNTTNMNQLNVAGSYIHGWNFFTGGWKTGSLIFFPENGVRQNQTGERTNMNVGHYYSSIVRSVSGNGNSLRFDSNEVETSQYFNRLFGFAVRPVTYEPGSGDHGLKGNLNVYEPVWF